MIANTEHVQVLFLLEESGAGKRVVKSLNYKMTTDGGESTVVKKRSEVKRRDVIRNLTQLASLARRIRKLPAKHDRAVSEGEL